MPDGTPTVSGVSGTAATTGSQATPTRLPGELDKDAFLSLLVAQLKYQNPLSPTDPSSMMAQTAQFTMVETLQQISKAQADAGAWQLVVAGQGLIGKHVTGGNEAAPVSGVVTGLTVTASGPVLSLTGGATLPLGSVTTVHEAAAQDATAGDPAAPASG